MAVEREDVTMPLSVGSVTVPRIYRGAAGGWSVEMDLNFKIKVGDGREVFVRKRINVCATEQRGRKRTRSQTGTPP